MTAKELREKLKDVPDDVEVLIFHADWIKIDNIIIRTEKEKHERAQ